jgi:hypothetical protein
MAGMAFGDPREELMAEVRRIAMATNAAMTEEPTMQSRVARLRRRLPPSGHLALLTAAAAFLLAAVVVFAVHWPPGGGRHISDFVFTQGASLVFVVILLSLLSGPVSAGQTLGWDSGWVMRDRQTWGGLAAVAGLSLFELWLGWSRPERAEAGASILLTAAGLCITVLVAWRLVYLSDPINQLAARVRTQVPAVMKRVREHRERAGRVLRQQITDQNIAAELALQMPPEAQRALQSYLVQLRAVAERAVHAGHWDLALRAHAAMTMFVGRYVTDNVVLTQGDVVLATYCTATSDLHAQAEGVRGRDFSAALVQNLRATALAAVRKDNERRNGPYSDVLTDGGFASFVFAMALRDVIVRRWQDDASADAPNAVATLGDLATVAAAGGDGWTGNGHVKKVMGYGLLATTQAKAHLAWPAWQGTLQTLRAMAVTGGDAFGDSASELTRAIESLETVPTPLHGSGFEPIITSMPGRLSLRLLAHAAWRQDQLDADELDRWTIGVARALHKITKATQASDTHAGYFACTAAAETIHQFNIAALIRGHEEAVKDGAHVLHTVGSSLSWMGALGLDDDGVVRGADFDEVAQRFFTDALMALHLAATRELEVPESLVSEVRRFVDRLERIDDNNSSWGLLDAIDAIARAFAAVGDDETRRAFAAAAEGVKAKARGQAIDVHGISGWGRLHRGDVVSSLHEEAEEWLQSLAPRSA